MKMGKTVFNGAKCFFAFTSSFNFARELVEAPVWLLSKERRQTALERYPTPNGESNNCQVFNENFIFS